jgi:hypothetical protein
LSRHSIIGLGLATALAVASCRCEERPPPSSTPSSEGAPVSGTAAPEREAEAEPSPPAPVAAPAGADGVEVPSTLVRQLALPARPEPEREEPVDVAACARGCALWAPDGALLLVLPTYEESPIPREIFVVRARSGAQESRRIDPGSGLSYDAIAAFEETGGEGDAPWAPQVARALRELAGADPSTFRRASSLVTHRARTVFSLDEYSPLVALGGAFEGRWLFAEIGETSYRFHLLRSDRSVDRLLATLPLEATACDGGFTDTGCIEPRSIEAVYASPDGRFLHAVVWSPTAGHGAVEPSTVLSLPLDDASAIPPTITAEARAADLERSLTAPGAMVRLWVDEPAEDDEGELDQTSPSARAARCLRGCALFLENGAPWVVRPSSFEHGEPLAPFVFRMDGTSSEILLPSDTDTDERVTAMERALADAPSGEPRRLVARQAVASWRGTARAALVELRAPHARARVGVELVGHEYVLSWITAAGAVEVGRAPALEVSGRPSPPGIVEAFAPPRLGFPIVVIGAAVTRLPSHAEGLAHGLFHVIVAGPPGGANAPGSRRTGSEQ